MSNEIVANGGLNGSYATITTRWFKLEKCSSNVVQFGTGLALGYGRKAALKKKCK
jgi:molybdopterin-containing oxidoreductase family iron-sulfur binding subunit